MYKYLIIQAKKRFIECKIEIITLKSKYLGIFCIQKIHRPFRPCGNEFLYA